MQLLRGHLNIKIYNFDFLNGMSYMNYLDKGSPIKGVTVILFLKSSFNYEKLKIEHTNVKFM